MKYLKFLIILLVVLLFTTCEKAETISGDSHLKVINNASAGIKIYFDDSFIGRVDSDENETWDVPTGSHTVKATALLYDDYETTLTFYEGETRIITITLSYENKMILQSNNQLLEKD